MSRPLLAIARSGGSSPRAAVGELLGLTAERARQIEMRALARLRERPEAIEAWHSITE